ncbi:MAG TPA: metalloregulator ArsR/SmtB family transcription factor [Longimicrobiaceae bacterium]|nr:metalloregulator ArsR/SmtB family transcription factor [Longimicrobiaceae bacterium]
MVNYLDPELSRTFAALADPTRRTILVRLAGPAGKSVSELARDLPVKLPAVLKHLEVLQNAGLVERTKLGRVVSVRLQPQPLKAAARWIHFYEAFWAGSLDKLALALEDPDASAP